MIKLIKPFILIGACLCLLALVAFIAVATHANLLIVIPACASAIYVAYAVAYWTMPEMVERFYLRLKKWADDA
jgi:hypothetical protein